MASQELLKEISNAEKYIERNGIDIDVVNAFHTYTFWANEKDNDIETALKIAPRAKELMNQYVINGAGGDIWELEKFCFANKTGHEMVDKWYQILKLEAPYKFESYLLYLEKKREISERFYSPKRKQLNKHGLIQAMQDLEDDKYDRICISMPPGTQKCQPLYSKVLTPNGFIQMEEVEVGTQVISGTGSISTVLSVSKVQKKKIYEITLENGYNCRCSADHLWHVRYNYFANKFKEKDVELNEILLCPYKYLIPVTTERLNSVFYLRVGVIECIGEEECKCIYIDDPSHLYITDNYIITHNTTLEKFFCSWIIGKYPKDYSLFFSHNSDITEKYYKGVLDITTDNLEYTWSEIFPDVKLQSTNAKLQEINFGKYKPYSSIQCSSIGSKNAGKVRTNRYLYCDDLIGSIEEALNPTILDKIWRIYGVDLKQRKLNQQVKEVIIMTRWSTKDVVGRIIELYGSSDRTKIISVEDIDPVTGESNFDYEYNGMTVEFFNDQALTMDDISYRCLYKQQPIEREGLLFPEGKVMRYDDEEIKKLREKPPELITGQCDTKGKGTDFFVLPCFEKYGDYYYCTDCVCDNSPDYELQYENSANLIVDNEMQDCVFESNAGGDRVAEEVQKRVEEKGWICNIRPMATETNKEARIFQCSNWILQHVKFKDKSMYAPKSQYGVMMAQLLSYSVSGKNVNDDVADVFATFALRIKRGNGRRKTIIMPSPI